jgi:hypothetical protein
MVTGEMAMLVRKKKMVETQRERGVWRMEL